MIVSVHQPAYLPWLGYIDKIAHSDIYIFFDSVQLESRGFTHRNRIKTSHGSLWLTVPIHKHGHRNCVISDIIIDESRDWRKHHLKAIGLNYCRAPFFIERFEKLETIYRQSYSVRKLDQLCWEQLHFWLNELSLKTEIIKSSSLLLKEKKSDLILEICQKLGATKYLSGELGVNYLELDKFHHANIEVEFQNYTYPSYTQLYGDFLPNLSIVDYWMNTNDIKFIRR